MARIAHTLRRTVQRSAAAFACAALLLALPQAPWRHVHAHGHDAHHARDGATFHAHVVPVDDAPAWRAHGPDEDARLVGGLLATPGVANPGCVATVNASFAFSGPTRQPPASPAPVSRGHDPPPRCRPAPRAPPA